ncbi:MAG: endopeptidase La [Clostridiales bacterium]|nr:MAG: endopeptidase La [Clostridiales bacterium]
MSKYIEKVENAVLPVIPLRGLVIFPGIPTSFEINNKKSIKALNAASSYNNTVFLSVMEKSSDSDEMHLSVTGITAKIKQSLKLPDGNYRVLIDGKSRAEYTELIEGEDFLKAKVLIKNVIVTDNGGIKGEALRREAILAFQDHIKLLPKISPEIVVSVQAITDPGMLADFIASNVLFDYRDKQQVLEETDPFRRLETLIQLLENESRVLEFKKELHEKVRERIDENQREYFLKEQLKVIREELGDTAQDQEEDELVLRIRNSAFSDEAKEKLLKDFDRMTKMPFGSSENSVLRNYLDTVLELPVGIRTKDVYSVQKARKILDEDHDGLKKVKDRILEYIAVKQLAPELKGQILCLIGPPGVGKSSVAVSVARALGRKFVRVSLGGVRDEADIRGHRKTYVGAMPGRIITAFSQAKSENPVILLDEIDKLTSNSQGDPASALLEVLDTEQNKSFRDHYIEIPTDLSDCIFIATANTAETIPHALYDRMEIIELPSYTTNEKVSIFKNHLLPKQLKRHGLNRRIVKVTDDAVRELIDFYTKEAGVRTLERQTASLCRKIAMLLAEGTKKSFVVTPDFINQLLGARKVKPDALLTCDTVGVVNGLAWTELGGEMLQVEAQSFDGIGKVELTGKLGDVMKESAQAAVSYIRKHAESLGIDKEFYKNRDIHIHVPEGAVPKDGPSAGVTMISALVSELSGIPARHDIAMTGEITLTGRVLPIGGLHEKSMAAYRNGIRTIIIPKDNLSDLEEVDDIIKENVTFVPVSNVSQVLGLILAKQEEPDHQDPLFDCLDMHEEYSAEVTGQGYSGHVN